MRAWERTDDGVRARFEDAEAAMFENLADQLKLLHRAAAQGAVEFADPAVQRLYPDGYSDPEEAKEFKRFSLPQIAESRERAQDAIIVGLVTADRKEGHRIVSVGDDEVDDWLRGVSDMRTVLSSRIELGTGGQNADFDEDDLEQFSAVVDWLGFVQASLLEAL
ncbi:DUF2017 family protein [uncultured Agrococcus sp.]|uniref:DUF2017 family protein n=1 Tax=uncultured Agrococcus sp. TaxID=382258 RepID=UPI0025D87AAD|nr:DUF2017 family protein [uncultured Agrococcus sp.]